MGMMVVRICLNRCRLLGVIVSRLVYAIVAKRGLRFGLGMLGAILYYRDVGLSVGVLTIAVVIPFGYLI
jgi:hypothetical protein